MVVKSTMAKEHCDALQQVFEILKKHQLKLNPKNAHLESNSWQEGSQLFHVSYPDQLKLPYPFFTA
ncbi:hypothetical protein CR513_42456, partial [Mucuna pruriens]